MDGLRLEEWGPDDLPLLHALLGDPAMTEHLGGPESEGKIVERLERYRHLEPGAGRMFKIVDAETGEPMGSVGYWAREWRGGDVWETGWSVLPAFQGRGTASRGTALALDRAREDGKHRFVHAFPGVDNGPSNAICRKLGFVLVEADLEFEYPAGSFMRCNDWRFDLFPAP